MVAWESENCQLSKKKGGEGGAAIPLAGDSLSITFQLQLRLFGFIDQARTAAIGLKFGTPHLRRFLL
jgi:hypothetical protein